MGTWFSTCHLFQHYLGSRDGAVVRALPYHQCVWFYAGLAKYICWSILLSRLDPRVFLQILRYFSFHKNQHFEFQFDQDRRPAWKPTKADVASSLNVVIIFNYLYNVAWLCNLILNVFTVFLPRTGLQSSQSNKVQDKTRLAYLTRYAICFQILRYYNDVHTLDKIPWDTSTSFAVECIAFHLLISRIA